MEKAIRIAIEGGYKDIHKSYDGMDYNATDDNATLLDPKFWQALGKAEKWKQGCPGVSYSGCRHEDKCNVHPIMFEKGWVIKMHSFIDHIIEGNSIDSFFRGLLK